MNDEGGMMKDELRKKWKTLLIIAVFLLSCNALTAFPTGNSLQPTEEEDSLVPVSTLKSDQPSLSTDGDSLVVGAGDEIVTIQLPSSPDVPAADVIQQIALFGGGGGAGPICIRNCISSDENNNAIFTKYHPNQRIRVVFYTNPVFDLNTSCYRYEYLTEVTLQIDSQGTLILNVTPNSGYQFTVLDENGVVLSSPEDPNFCSNTPK